MSDVNTQETGRLARQVCKPEWLDFVLEQVQSIRFGTVTITVHESRVAQVEKHEKVRLDQPTTPPPEPEPVR